MFPARCVIPPSTSVSRPHCRREINRRNRRGVEDECSDRIRRAVRDLVGVWVGSSAEIPVHRRCDHNCRPRVKGLSTRRYPVAVNGRDRILVGAGLSRRCNVAVKNTPSVMFLLKKSCVGQSRTVQSWSSGADRSLWACDPEVAGVRMHSPDVRFDQRERHAD